VGCLLAATSPVTAGLHQLLHTWDTSRMRKAAVGSRSYSTHMARMTVSASMLHSRPSTRLLLGLPAT
jgi:hypothetical protein